MVDRYKSFMDDSMVGSVKKNNTSSFLIESQTNQYTTHIKTTQRCAAAMRTCINDYKLATTKEQQQQIVESYQAQQQKMKQSRQHLARKYRQLEQQKDTTQILFVKQHLLKTVQKQLTLDVEFSQTITNRKKSRQMQSKKLIPGSQRLKNALNDLQQKRDQLIYLDQSVKQCVDLLQIINILVLEQGQKISTARQRVEKANQMVDLSLKKIQIAKIRSQKSTNRKCCIIILGLLVIIALLGTMGYIFVIKN